MGLFSKRTGPVDVGHFSSPHDLDAMLSVVYAGVRDQLSSPAPEVGTPSPAGSIYLSRYGRDGLTVTAGNTIETFFNFHVDLTPTANGVEGHAYFDRPSSAIQRWMGNAMNLHFGLRLALSNASIPTARWNDRY
jgi:hypothetical protein